VTIHYVDPDGGETTYSRSTTQLPPEPVEIKPHPYGIELGQLVTVLKNTSVPSMAQFLTTSFSRVSSGVAQKLCEAAKIGARVNPRKIGRHEPAPSHEIETADFDRILSVNLRGPFLCSREAIRHFLSRPGAP
jgi:DNA topoisomerase VI subunit B